MKKIMLSLLAVAATLNVMAINIDAKAQITLTADGSSDSYTLYLVESSDLNAGYNKSYCGEIMDLSEFPNALYIQYGGKNYSSFGTKDLAASDIALKAKLDGVSTSYTLTVSNVSGSKALKLVFGSKEIELKNGTYSLTPTELAAASKVAADVAKDFCFAEELLKVNGYAGKSLEIWKDGAASAMETVSALPATYQKDFSAEAAGKYIIKFDGVTNVFTDGLVHEYVIDVKPATTKKP